MSYAPERPAIIRCPDCRVPVAATGFDFHYKQSCNPTGQPQIVVVSASLKWRELEYAKDVLRKMAWKYPNLSIRTDGGNGAAAEVTHFCEALGWSVTQYRAGKDWSGESRNRTMLTGIRHLENTYELVGKRADLTLAFWAGTGDNTNDLIKAALKTCDPVFVYREMWKKSKKHDPLYLGITRFQNDKNHSFQLGEGVPVFVPEKEKEAA